jgi:cold shock CspA family protein
MVGLVTNYNSEKRYGFLKGDDGQSYFFHVTDVMGDLQIAVNSAASFEPSISPKGLRARHVVIRETSALGPQVGSSPQASRPRTVYCEPDHFIMTRGPGVQGYEIERIIAEDCWGEAFDPNQAKAKLEEYAVSLGANAIVSMYLEKYSAPVYHWALAAIAGDYHRTMHRFHGTAVVLKKRVITRDLSRGSE